MNVGKEDVHNIGPGHPICMHVWTSEGLCLLECRIKFRNSNGGSTLATCTEFSAGCMTDHCFQDGTEFLDNVRSVPASTSQMELQSP